jgi:DNA polymerase-1
MMEVITKFKPSHVIALFDAPGPTVRHDQFAEYKINRKKPEDDLLNQIPRIEDLLNVFDIPILRVQGFEADDIIGTIDDRHSGDWARTIIVTGDRDLFQLVDEDTFVYMAGGAFSQSQLFDAEAVKTKMGIGPEYITDYKGLFGDTSDGIPGVRGIGDKSALALIQEFGHLEEVYQKIEQVPSRYKNKLEENYEMAILSKKLATIIKDVPLSFDFAEAEFGTYDPTALRQFFIDMQFNSLLGKLNELMGNIAPKSPVASEQLSMMDMIEEAPVNNWTGQSFTDTKVFVVAEYLQPGDPLTWGFADIYVNDGTQNYQVSREQTEEFWKKLKAEWVITDNAKSLMHSVKNLNIELKPRVYDMCISTYVLSSGQSKQDLDGILSYYKQDYRNNKSSKLTALNAAYKQQTEELDKSSKLAKLLDVEVRLVPVIVEMERTGIVLDAELMWRFENILTKAIEATKDAIYLDVGHEFNISSPKQVAEVLFVEKALPGGKRTKGGAYSTDERILRDLVGSDPVVEKILNYRELTKLLSTYVKPLPTLINPETKRIHASFNQVGALTGRFSSQYPNMQNIPLGEVEGVHMRDAFIAPIGSLFVSFDYSQQELRLLAELSNEENMLDTFRRGEDIHSSTAAEIFEIELDKVTKEQRNVAKTVNFGVIYGISAFGLSDRLKIDPKKAAGFIDKYFANYPKVREYYDKLIAEARSQNYVETLLGRRRTTYDLSSNIYQLRQATEREVMNFPLQGSAADLIKLAMLEIQPLLKDIPAKLILQVHDELIFEYKTPYDVADLIKDKEFVDFVRNIRQTMLNVIKLKVPLEVGVDVGHSWGKMSEIKLD